MYDFLFVLSLMSLLLGPILVFGTPIVPEEHRAGRTYVSSISQCPSLSARSDPPTSVHDLRPDDFSYALAIGDSITAGAFLRGVQGINIPKTLSEWRGQSYSGGGDAGAITLPNLLKNYNPSLTGGSIGSTTLSVCSNGICPGAWNAAVDQLNGALSGALAVNMLHEVDDYLVPQIRARDIPDGAYKFLSFQIGSNDICKYCAQADNPNGDGSPDDWEANIRAALEAIRTKIPNVVVNLLGVFSVQDVYTVSLNQSYCNRLIPLSVECGCTATEKSRQQMAKLREQYDQRLIKIIKEYQQAKYPGFYYALQTDRIPSAVLWQPPNLPLSTFPVQFLSNVDCFHPSLDMHELMASALWNRLVGNAADRAVTITWTTDLTFRCLEKDDRIQTNTLL